MNTYNAYDLTAEAINMGLTALTMRSYSPLISTKTVLREYRTVTVDFGRNTGKSTFINEVSSEDDIVLCINEMERRNHYNSGTEAFTYCPLLKSYEYRLRGRNFQKGIMWVDNASLFPEYGFSTNDLYNLAASLGVNAVVRLG